MEHILSGLIFLAVCLGLAFVLSGMEAGVLALSRFRLRGQMRRGIRRAQRLHAYLENSEDFLWTILVGNTLATFAAFSLIVVTLYDRSDGQPAVVGVGLGFAAFLFYMFCDLLPK